MKKFRILFETVYQHKLVHYMTADPLLYTGTTQTVPNSEIPDEHWYEVTTEADNPWDQYWVLLKWAGQDKHFVRNVRVEQLVSEPVYRPIDTNEAVRLAADQGS